MRITTTPGYLKKILKKLSSLSMEKSVIFMNKRLELSCNETVQFLYDKCVRVFSSCIGYFRQKPEGILICAHSL